MALDYTFSIIKPDAFTTGKAGKILAHLEAQGFTLKAARVLQMSRKQAEEFYGPVRDVLRNKLGGMAAERASKAIEQELGFKVGDDIKSSLAGMVGPAFGDNQFYTIIKFMTGLWVPDVPAADKPKPGLERCLVLLYRGPKAVEKIRKILGPTDPSKAEPGSVRKEYGKDIMVNAAHASDSPENAQREMKIVKVDEDIIGPTVRQFYGS